MIYVGSKLICSRLNIFWKSSADNHKHSQFQHVDSLTERLVESFFGNGSEVFNQSLSASLHVVVLELVEKDGTNVQQHRIMKNHRRKKGYTTCPELSLKSLSTIMGCSYAQRFERKHWKSNKAFFSTVAFHYSVLELTVFAHLLLIVYHAN